jgi:hypothetical protein
LNPIPAGAGAGDVPFSTAFNWRIEANQSRRALRLVGEVTDGKFADFSVECSAGADGLAAAVPLTDPGEKAALAKAGGAGAALTVWSDHTRKQNLALPGNGDALLAGDSAGPDGARFLKTLESATTHFAYQAGGPVRMYDASRLQPILKRFKESCAAISRDFDGFMKGRAQ